MMLIFSKLILKMRKD